MATDMTNARAFLRKFLVEKFSLEEIKELAFDLDVDYQRLHHQTKRELVIDLILYFEHRDKLDFLAKEMLSRRPEIELAQLLTTPPASLRWKEAQATVDKDRNTRADPSDTASFHSCFISNSSKDSAFAQKLYSDLKDSGVRVWMATEDLRIGDKIRTALDQSILRHNKLLLILSEHSISSDWVEQEVETALAQERKQNEAILFPIRLDNEIMQREVGWPSFIRNTRYIGDFRYWQNELAYQKAFRRLLHDLTIQD